MVFKSPAERVDGKKAGLFCRIRDRGGGRQPGCDFHAFAVQVCDDGHAVKLAELLFRIEFAVGELILKVVQTVGKTLTGIDIFLQLLGGERGIKAA